MISRKGSVAVILEMSTNGLRKINTITTENVQNKTKPAHTTQARAKKRGDRRAPYTVSSRATIQNSLLPHQFRSRLGEQGWAPSVSSSPSLRLTHDATAFGSFLLQMTTPSGPLTFEEEAYVRRRMGDMVSVLSHAFVKLFVSVKQQPWIDTKREGLLLFCLERTPPLSKVLKLVSFEEDPGAGDAAGAGAPMTPTKHASGPSSSSPLASGGAASSSSSSPNATASSSSASSSSAPSSPALAPRTGPATPLLSSLITSQGRSINVLFCQVSF